MSFAPTLQNAAAMKAANPANVGIVANRGGSRIDATLANFANKDTRKANEPANRYDKILQKRTQNAYLGGTDEDYLRDVSHGHFDFSRELKISIRREYFTLHQYIGGVILGLSIGLIVATIAVTQLYKITFRNLNQTYRGTTGLMLVCLAVGIRFGSRYARRPTRCAKTGPKAKFVDASKKYGEGADCITNSDCTESVRRVSGMCRVPPNQGHMLYGRVVLPIIALLAGIILLILQERQGAPWGPAGELFSFVVFGLSGGFIIAYIFS
jgi:hypothetical protein